MFEVEAREALVAALLGWPDPLPKVVIKYLGLLSPRGRAMKFDRLTIIIKELVTLIATREMTRQDVTRNLSHDLWAEGMRETLLANDEGRLILPLKSHEWLKSVVWNIAAKVNVALPLPAGGGRGEGGFNKNLITTQSEFARPRPQSQLEVALIELEKLKQGARNE